MFIPDHGSGRIVDGNRSHQFIYQVNIYQWKAI